MSTAKATWDDIRLWAKAGIEAARTALETAKPDDAIPLQAQIKVLRDLLAINDAPVKPTLTEMPSYTDR